MYLTGVPFAFKSAKRAAIDIGLSESGVLPNSVKMSALSVISPTLEVLDCSKEYALSPNDPPEFFEKGLLKSPQPLGRLNNARAIVYRLKPKPGAKLSVPEQDGQTVKTDPDGVLVVTVRRQAAPETNRRRPTPTSCPASGCLPQGP